MTDKSTSTIYLEPEYREPDDYLERMEYDPERIADIKPRRDEGKSKHALI